MTTGSKIYNLFMYPLEKARLMELRRQLIPMAEGTVLEVGTGTGVNLKYYHYDKIEKLYLSDLKVNDAVRKSNYLKNRAVEFLNESVEKLSLADKSIDTVVFTLVFCSVTNPLAGLSEIKRVLKDNGKIIFIEHVLPHDKRLKKMVNSTNHLWVKMANGCHINRETVKTIREAGFTVIESIPGKTGIFASGLASKMT
ncbi:MAG: class I SAM-dependent methyltransferase [Clostridia bacterium]|nr:class I SAM-dependent methyltransferase [Clostridia bacterium]